MSSVEERLADLTVDAGAPPAIGDLAAAARHHARRRRTALAVAAVAVVVAVGLWLAPRTTGPARLASTGDGPGAPATTGPDLSQYRDISARILSTPAAFSMSMLEGEFPSRWKGSEALYHVVLVIENDAEQIQAVTVSPWRIRTDADVAAIGNEQCPGTQDACNGTTVSVDMQAAYVIAPLYFKDRLLPDGRTLVDADVTVIDTTGVSTTETVEVEITTRPSTSLPPRHSIMTTTPPCAEPGEFPPCDPAPGD
jgi:hypothetical protein